MLFSYLLILANLLNSSFFSCLLLVPFDGCAWFRNNNTDQISFQTVAINKDLLYEKRSDVDVFDFFRGYIFPLSEFENVFLPVNDLQRPRRQNLSNVPGPQEPFLIKKFGCQFWILIISCSYTGTFDKNLSLFVGLKYTHY